MSTDKEIIFAVPGSKVYISKYYNNRINSFLNISLTGKKCELMCSHCKARLLSDMTDINSPDIDFPDDLKMEKNRLIKIITRGQKKGGISAGGKHTGAEVTADKAIEIDHETNNFRAIYTKADYGGDRSSEFKDSLNRVKSNVADYNKATDIQTTVNGILISGGFDSRGRLPLDERILPEIKEVKDKYGREIKILMHLGFTDKEMAKSLYECGIDGTLVNVFSDRHSIEEIYNLKNCSPDMFYENIRLLKEAGLSVSPHLIIGLGESSLSGEYRSVKEIAGSGADTCVFVIAKKLSKQDRFEHPKVRPSEVIALFEYAKSIMPQIPITLGCARPHGLEFEKMEIELLRLGIDVIAFPSERTLDYAKDNNYRFHFEEQCCAFLAKLLM